MYKSYLNVSVPAFYVLVPFASTTAGNRLRVEEGLGNYTAANNKVRLTSHMQMKLSR